MNAPQGRPKARAPWGEAARSAASGGAILAASGGAYHS